MSIDSRDRYGECKPEDLSVNDIETFTEFIAEVVLGHANAFAEHDEHDDERSASQGGQVILFHPDQSDIQVQACTADRFTYLISNAGINNPLSAEIASPPPKV